MTIRSLDDLRPGDIMVAGMHTAPTKLLVYGGQFLLREHFRIGKFVAGHAGVITESGKLVEAVSSGARERDLRDTDWSDSQVYFRLPDDYPGQHIDAAAVARAMVGTPYSLASYAYLAAYLAGFKPQKLAEHINRRHDLCFMFTMPSGHITTHALPVEAICSVLVDQAWTLTGKTIIRGTKPQVVTPGMLTQHLWAPGIVMGGAGLVQN